jgi:hypothetical protein
MKRLTIRGTALSLGLFFDVSFVLCILWGLAVPQFHAKGVPVLEAILPGFAWLTPQSFILGLVEAFLYGWYVALVFVPLFNYFEAERPAEAERSGMAQPREARHHP